MTARGRWKECRVSYKRKSGSDEIRFMEEGGLVL